MSATLKTLIHASLLAMGQLVALPAAQAQSPAVPSFEAKSARPGYVLRAEFVQTESFYATSRNLKFRDNVPYKKPVRIVSNLFEFPEEYDAVRSQDVVNQFYEYLMAKHPELVEKLRGHKSSETPESLTLYKGREEVGENSYRGLFNGGTNPDWTYEIVYVDGFKYVERKAKSGLSKATLKARSIIGDPAAGKKD